MSINKITYCMVVLNRLEEMKTALRGVCPYVTRTVVVDGGSTDGTIEWLGSAEAKELNIEYRVSKQHRYAEGDHTPRERNQYLEMAGHDGWLLYTDSDEFLEEAACKNFDLIITMAETLGYNGVLFRSHDLWTYETGEVYDNQSNYWNTMMWKGAPGQHYAGHTHSHIVRPGVPPRWMRTDFKYRHVKTERRMWHNSTFLYWTTAQIAQNTTNDPTWRGFHALMGKYGHVDWHVFNKKMTAGNLPQEIKDWFIAHKDATSSEERSWFVWYFIFLHPEENVDQLGNIDFKHSYVEDCAQHKARSS